MSGMNVLGNLILPGADTKLAGLLYVGCHGTGTHVADFVFRVADH